MKARIILFSVCLLSTIGVFAQDTGSASYWEVFSKSFGSYGNYIWSEITFQTPNWYENYFWMLIMLSLVVWGLEILFPWRKNQSRFRKDFWLDAFYMFFNFYLFRLIIFAAFANVTEKGVTSLFGGDMSFFMLIDLRALNPVLQFVIFFVAMDFIQWFTHRTLHRFEFLWRFHKVHHSVEEMGFAAHLRYHWMENVFYTPMKYMVVIVLGNFYPETAFLAYYFATAIGHLNHANVDFSYGPLKYIFNNPKMHIWHHAHDLPESHKQGANFGISLSVWDYLFRTNYIPYDGKDIKLGFDKMEKFPKTFFGQLFYGFTKEKDEV